MIRRPSQLALNPRRRPQWPFRIDRDHPIAKSLRFFIVPVGSAMVDLVTGRIGTKNDTPFTVTLPPDGPAVDLDGVGSNDYYSFADHDDYDITDDITLLWRGSIDGLGSLHFIGKESLDVSSGPTPFYLDTVLYPTSGTYPLRFMRTPSSSVYRLVRGPNVINDRLIRTYGVTSPAAAASCTFYLDGVGSAPITTADGTGTTSAGNALPLRIGMGNFTSGAPQMGGKILYVAGWARQLSDVENKRMHAQPWCMLRPAYDGARHQTVAAALRRDPVNVNTAVHRAANW